MPGKHAVTLTAYRDGPMLVRGSCAILDQDGRALDRRTRAVALCRCGKSRLLPLCDGTHKLVGFRAPAERIVIDDH